MLQSQWQLDVEAQAKEENDEQIAALEYGDSLC